MKEKIDFKTFLEIEKQLEMKLGLITNVERMEKSDKMLKLTVDFEEDELRIVMTNIGDKIDDVEKLKNMILPFVTNLKPAKVMGVSSTAMVVVPLKHGNIDLDGNQGCSLI